MTDSRNQGDELSELKPEIRRAPIAQLTIYEISEAELEILAQGSANLVVSAQKRWEEHYTFARKRCMYYPVGEAN